jgi:hypothetical protein
VNGFRFKAKSLGRYSRRHKPGEMNKTEILFSDLLQARKLAGEIVDWWFEPIRFVLGDKCSLTLDFGVLHNDGSMEFIDAKGTGPVQEDAIIKMKMAAEKFYMFTIAMEKQQTKKQGSGWKRREF